MTYDFYGVPGAKLKDRIRAPETRKAELIDLLANAEETPPLRHPNIAEVFRQRISALRESLRDEDRKTEAVELFRTLIDQVTLVFDDGRLAIVLPGDLTAMLRLLRARKTPPWTKAGFWETRYRKNLWLRATATPDCCDWSSARFQSSLRETANAAPI